MVEWIQALYSCQLRLAVKDGSIAPVTLSVPIEQGEGNNSYPMTTPLPNDRVEDGSMDQMTEIVQTERVGGSSSYSVTISLPLVDGDEDGNISSVTRPSLTEWCEENRGAFGSVISNMAQRRRALLIHFQYYLGKSTPQGLYRWIGTSILAVLYVHRIWNLEGRIFVSCVLILCLICIVVVYNMIRIWHCPYVIIFT